MRFPVIIMQRLSYDVQDIVRSPYVLAICNVIQLFPLLCFPYSLVSASSIKFVPVSSLHIVRS